jgi:hypothetical protein
VSPFTKYTIGKQGNNLKWKIRSRSLDETINGKI